MLFYFRVFMKTIEKKLLNKTTERMKNYVNHSSESNIQDYDLDGVPLAEISEFVIFEVLLALISLLIVSTSSLVIYRITKAKGKNSRSYFVFICLSEILQCTNIGRYALLSTTSAWNTVYLAYPWQMFQFFSYTFSCLFTAVIAADRFPVITQDRKYKDLITPKILKVVAIILFLCSVINSCIITTHNMQSERYSTGWMKDLSSGYSIAPLVIFVVAFISTFIVILTHLYILYFASKDSSLKKLRKHHDKNHNRKKLANTIITTCISQLILVTPYLVCQFAAHRFPDKLFLTIATWLASFQSFCNALIILRNKKSRKNSKQIEIKAI